MTMMKAITHLAVATLGAVAMSASAFAKTPEGWQDNVDAAIELAKKENKSVLLEFTGSDWCPPCIMMQKEVFSKKDFYTKASEDFILVHLDFPNGDPELKEKNQPVAEKYAIEGFPTVILLDSEGKEFDRFFASEFPKVDPFLAHLDEALEKKEMD
ncbi:thioredoxin family protein [Luteolibacter sp. AS25]|uniref:thioredoxin family protein n=1 Tax=Luteolibacter sp. AS25 TaxID=3135776 RepID=UPI00398B4B50